MKALPAATLGLQHGPDRPSRSEEGRLLREYLHELAEQAIETA